MCNGINIHLLRQIFINMSTFLHSMSVGVMLAFPSALNPALLSPNNTDIHATADQASWLASSETVSGVVALILTLPLMQMLGRKTVYLAIILINCSSWITFILSKSVAALFAARIINGFTCAGLFVGTMIISEYSHPTRRGYFSAIKKTFSASGSLLCHALTLWCTWRQIAAVALVPLLMSGIITLFWPESPSYLAMKGRFEECEKSIVWLNGDSLESQKELKELIAAQKEIIEKKQYEKNGIHLSEVVNIITDRGFLRALSIVSVLTLVVDACGRYYFLAYIIQMMIEITGDKSIAVYCSVGADVLIITALILSSIVIRYFKRRTLLLRFGGFSTFLMFLIGLLKLSLSGFSAVKWLIVCVVILHNFIVFLSIVPVCYTLFGELFPLEHRGMGSSVAGIVLICFFGVTMKLTPVLMDSVGIEGTYATYGSVLFICFVILYFILPETKDRTLQNIEDEMKGVKRPLPESEPMLEN